MNNNCDVIYVSNKHIIKYTKYISQVSNIHIIKYTKYISQVWKKLMLLKKVMIIDLIQIWIFKWFYTYFSPQIIIILNSFYPTKKKRC